MLWPIKNLSPAIRKLKLGSFLDGNCSWKMTGAGRHVYQANLTAVELYNFVKMSITHRFESGVSCFLVVRLPSSFTRDS